MKTLYQFKHGVAAHKDIEEALFLSRMFVYHYQGLFMNIKLALILCLSNIGWLQQLNRRHGPALFFTQQIIDAL